MPSKLTAFRWIHASGFEFFRIGLLGLLPTILFAPHAFTTQSKVVTLIGVIALSVAIVSLTLCVIGAVKIILFVPEEQVSKEGK